MYQTHGSGPRHHVGNANSSSVLRSINDILREDRELPTRSRSTSAHRYDAYGVSPTRSRYTYGSHSRGASPSRTTYGGPAYGGLAYGPPSEEERSMERLASTFRTEDYTSSLYERLHDFSPLTSDQEMTSAGHGVNSHMGLAGGDYPPAAMPLLPDMPSRSRKLLEDLAASGDLPRGKYGGREVSTSRYLSPRNWTHLQHLIKNKKRKQDRKQKRENTDRQQFAYFKIRFGHPSWRLSRRCKIYIFTARWRWWLHSLTHVRAIQRIPFEYAALKHDFEKKHILINI